MSEFEKLNIKEAVIVEGKYDKIRLQSVICSTIITINGFRVFKDKEAQQLIRKLAQKRGILVMTDVDSAGFVLRNFLKGIVDEKSIKHCYIPTVYGKEKRKAQFSKERKIGVEGIDANELVNAILKSGATILGQEKAPNIRKITKADFYDFGLCGKSCSKKLREALLSYLQMPPYLTTNAMISAVNCIYTYEEFNEILNYFYKNMEVNYES
ncbi:MAG: DUF4093 domain-containing protein [Ruminococcus sp.]|nr:DUF4093 domain-containing protein [Ruminococcus sp.]